MAITVSDERKSTRITLRDDGRDILSAGIDYNPRNVSLIIDIFDPEYCSRNAGEIQEVITAFIGKTNGFLAEANLPTIGALTE